MATRRQVSIYINGREIENTIKSITAEKRKLNAELDRMVRGTEEYEKAAAELGKVNGILDEHRKKVSGIGQAVDGLTKGGGLARFASLAGAAFAADEIIAYGKHLFELSGQMELLENRARTVFGEVYPQVTAEAERNAAAIGLTTSQYINAATAIGDFLVPMQFSREEAANMSVDLVNLSGALAEWEGGQRSAAEVSQILSKAMLGEREELKSLGIAISEEDVQNKIREKGLKNLTGVYAQQAEAIATIEIITQSSADAVTAFANSSETLARRQAALRAEITSISEKLATTLYPIFEGLVNVASNFASGLKGVADGFTAMINPAKAANDAFNEQASKVANLEAELPPLLDRYEELKGKSKLTKTEQTELSKVIQRIGEITPGAITEIDKYGRVLSINAGASRDFLVAEQARLKFLNKDAITTTNKQVSALEKQLAIEQKLVNTGKTYKTQGVGFQQRIVITDASPEEIDQARRKVAELAGEIKGAKEQLKVLQGEVRTDTKPTKPPGLSAEDNLNRVSGAPTDKEIKAAAKQKEKQLAEIEKGEEAIKKVLEKYRLENFLAGLDDEEKKIEALRAKYNQDIEKVKELEQVKAEQVTAAVVELERLREEEISKVREEYRKTAEEKEIAAEQAALEKELAAVSDRVAKTLEARAAAQEAIQEFVLNEQDKALLELENQYLELINTTGLGEEQKLQLLRAYEEKKAALRKQFADKEKAENVTARKEQFEALSQSYAAYANIIGGALTALGGVLSEQTAAGKVLALAQIAFNTAAAISSAVAAGAGLVFPANLGAIASGVTAVLTAIGSAKKILASAPKTTNKVAQRYTGGFYDVTGATDGRHYNAQYLGQQSTGLLPPYPVLLASERGPEYLIANEDLRNPTVLNHVRAIENIRASRGGSVPQYAEGGFTAPPAQASAIPDEMMAVMANMMATNQALLQAIQNGIPAIVGDTAIVDLEERKRLLNRASGGVLG